MSFSTWLAFAVSSLALVIIPGPTVMLVIGYALSHGRRVALSVVAGVAIGDLTARTLSLAGLGALLLTSAALFTALKWVGAAYLIYLGIRLWRADPHPPGQASPPASHRLFGHAFLVTALNPKSLAFFVAFVPHFIDPDRDLLPQLVLMEATFILLGSLNALAYALAAERMGRQIRRPSVLRWFNRGGGACLVGMGLATAAQRG